MKFLVVKVRAKQLTARLRSRHGNIRRMESLKSSGIRSDAHLLARLLPSTVHASSNELHQGCLEVKKKILKSMSW